MDWLDNFLGSTVGKTLFLPALPVVGVWLGYLIRRKIEKSGQTTELNQLHSIADLHEKINRQDMSVEDLKNFRQKLFGKSAKAATETAKFYIEKANYLTSSGELIEHEPSSEAVTQADMNAEAFAAYAAADSELTGVILEKLATATDEELQAFQLSQDAWIQWRRAEAEWDSRVWEGGTIRPLFVAAKLEQLTRERIAAVRNSGIMEYGERAATVVYKAAPRDLPNHLEPGITSDRIREIIGTPHYIYGEIWHYRFKEFQLELSFKAGVLVEVTFAMVRGQIYEVELAMNGHFKFGKLTFADLRDLDPELDIEFRSTLRTNEIYCRVRLGPPGAWRVYYFGAIIPYSGTALADTDFEWDRDTNTLKSPLESTVINWFGESSNYEDAPWASWSIR